MIIINISFFALFPDSPSDHDVCRRLQSPREEDPIEIQRHIVIAVHKCDILSRCFPCTQDSGTEKADIFRKINKADCRTGPGVRIRSCIFLYPLTDIPLRPVVHHKDLKIRTGLFQKAVHASCEIFLRPVHGNDDRYERSVIPVIHPTFPSS